MALDLAVDGRGESFQESGSSIGAGPNSGKGDSVEKNTDTVDPLDCKVAAVTDSLEAVRKAVTAFTPSRERSIALTKIEEAQMWMEKVARAERFACRVIG